MLTIVYPKWSVYFVNNTWVCSSSLTLKTFACDLAFCSHPPYLPRRSDVFYCMARYVSAWNLYSLHFVFSSSTFIFSEKVGRRKSKLSRCERGVFRSETSPPCCDPLGALLSPQVRRQIPIPLHPFTSVGLDSDSLGRKLTANWKIPSSRAVCSLLHHPSPYKSQYSCAFSLR